MTKIFGSYLGSHMILTTYVKIKIIGKVYINLEFYHKNYWKKLALRDIG